MFGDFFFLTSTLGGWEELGGVILFEGSLLMGIFHSPDSGGGDRSYTK